ncbi:DUF4251 domain-containing protein [Flavivirga spongiicola]|uniref:DUF4251 domain-containing protein n=1 Tax=Flavivirga spongiicola TaxID=421621 RepID=A0ABU7XXV5_9FLAO|nr:DUF4251 domain-containing protein [Flavivirga sp. MEBiC05379]MDO5980607.1 DUF4251 domain-containing protein [Flavivirga sp. MEBiC05379]
MKPLYFFIGIGIMVIFSCKSKSAATQVEIDALNTIVKKQMFRIDSDWAYPQVTNAMQQVLNSGLMQPGSSANAISLIGNDNFLTISKDSISSFLPYFGERQMQVAYNGGDSAIQFNGVFEDYEVVHNKDNSYNISFQAKSNSENFQVFIKLYPNLKAHMTLNGNSRLTIRYSGSLELIE